MLPNECPEGTASLPMAIGALGFGAFLSRTESWRVLDAFWDLGGRIVDVAPSYGRGEARELVKTYVKRRNRNLILWDKFGLEYKQIGSERGAATVNFDNPRKYTDGLRRTASDMGYPIRCLQVHAPIPRLYRNAVLEELAKIKSDGVIETIGMCNHSPDQVDALVESAGHNGLQIEYAQVHLNIYEQRATVGLLPLLRTREIKAWANRIFARGALLTRPSATPRMQASKRLCDYLHHNQDGLNHLQAVFAQFAPHSPINLMTSWVITHPEIDGFVLGASTPEQVQEVVVAIKNPVEQTTISAFDKAVTGLGAKMRPKDLFDREY